MENPFASDMFFKWWQKLILLAVFAFFLLGAVAEALAAPTPAEMRTHAYQQEVASD